MTDEYICDELIKRDIHCSHCGIQRWRNIEVHRDDKGMIGFDGECGNCDGVIRGYLPMYTCAIHITHNGEPQQTAIRY